jgi:hypothetical protein
MMTNRSCAQGYPPRLGIALEMASGAAFPLDWYFLSRPTRIRLARYHRPAHNTKVANTRAFSGR